MKIELKKIDAQTTIPIRQQVLRDGKPKESCWFDGDLLTSTFHVGLYVDVDLVGIISVFEKCSVLFSDLKQHQIRGMSVLNAFQKNGYGEKLVVYAENELKLLSSDLIWFNARLSAVGFYEKMGYNQIGKIFNIDEIGEHMVMFKRLNSNHVL